MILDLLAGGKQVGVTANSHIGRHFGVTGATAPGQTGRRCGTRPARAQDADPLPGKGSAPQATPRMSSVRSIRGV